MAQLVFFGAGVSATFGHLTMKGIIPEFEKHLQGDRREFYDEVWKTLEASYPYIDLETVFSVIDRIAGTYSFADLGPVAAFHSAKYFHIDSAIAQLSPTREDVELARVVRDDFRKFVRKEFQVRPDRLNDIDSCYRAFFDILAKHRESSENYFGGSSGFNFLRWPIFTTNYDLNLETFFDRQGIPLNAGATPVRQMMILNVDSLDKDDLTLVKLHGSLNWIKVGDRIRIETLPSDCEYTVDGQRVQGEVVLYPVVGKELYRHPYLDLFRIFKKELSRTKTWVVAGYRFNDEVIRQMFIDACSYEKKMILIHPRPQPILEGHLAPIKDRVTVLEAEFGEAVTNQLAKLDELMKPTKPFSGFH